MEDVKTYKNVELLDSNISNYELPKIREDFIAKLENALMFLNYKDLNMWHSEAKNSLNLKSFDGSWLIDVSLKHDKEEAFTFSPFGEFQVTPDMFPNLNIKLFNLSGEIGYMNKYRFLDLKEKRHLQKYKYIFSEQFAFLDYGSKKWWTNEQGYGFNSATKLEDNNNVIIPIPTPLKSGFFYDKKEVIKKMYEDLRDTNSMYFQTIKNFHMALQLSLTYHYEWSCYIKETQNSLGVRIPIHPSSSKSVFMMRNTPEGSQRKKAIVNFVKDHYRTIKGYNDNERKVLIQKHFRGELKFNWRGLEVHITPSPYDLMRVKSKRNFKTFDV